MILTKISFFSYDKKVKLVSILLSLVLVFGIFSKSWAQCEVISTPMAPLVAQLEKDLSKIFANLDTGGASKLGPKSHREPVPSLYEHGSIDHLIIASQRVGPFVLGSSVSNISSFIRLSAQKKSTDSRYADLLPLGYVPERDFRKGMKMGVHFAFSLEGVLKEIFVDDPKYSTPEGLKIGSSLSSLKKLKLEKRMGKDRRQYFVGKGITFIGDKREIVEIFIFPH